MLRHDRTQHLANIVAATHMVATLWVVATDDGMDQFWQERGDTKVKSPKTDAEINLSTLRGSDYADDEAAKEIIRKEYEKWKQDTESADSGADGADGADTGSDAADTEPSQNPADRVKGLVRELDSQQEATRQLEAQLGQLKEDLKQAQANLQRDKSRQVRDEIADVKLEIEDSKGKEAQVEAKLSEARQQQTKALKEQADKVVGALKRVPNWRASKPNQSSEARTPNGSIMVGAGSKLDSAAQAKIRNIAQQALKDGKPVIVLADAYRKLPEGLTDAVSEGTEGTGRLLRMTQGSLDLGNPYSKVWKTLEDSVGGDKDLARAYLVMGMLEQGSTYADLKSQGWDLRDAANQIKVLTGVDPTQNLTDENKAALKANSSAMVGAALEVYANMRQARLMAMIQELEADGNVVIAAPNPSDAYSIEQSVSALPAVEVTPTLRRKQVNEQVNFKMSQFKDIQEKLRALDRELSNANDDNRKEIQGEIKTLEDELEVARKGVARLQKRTRDTDRELRAEEFQQERDRLQGALDVAVQSGEKKAIKAAQAALDTHIKARAAEIKKESAQMFEALGIQPKSTEDEIFDILMQIVTGDSKMEKDLLKNDDVAISRMLSETFDDESTDWSEDDAPSKRDKKEPDEAGDAGEAAEEPDEESFIADHPDVKIAQADVDNIEAVVKRVIDGDLNDQSEELARALNKWVRGTPLPDDAQAVLDKLNDELGNYLSPTVRLFRVNPGTKRLEFLGQEWTHYGKPASRIMQLLPDMLEDALREDSRNKIKFDKLKEAQDKARKDFARRGQS